MPFNSPQIPLFLGTGLGAIALLLMMPRARGDFRLLGGLLGAIAVGGLWLVLHGFISDLGAMTWSAFTYYYVFSAIAIIGAVRVITHRRPVYSALWLVMVVLSTAGLFLVMAVEFMAFAMIIIYGGAILVTYMFVIMLASQAQGEADGPDVSPSYDRIAREPLAATVAGFVLLAVLLSVAFEPMQPEPSAAGASDAAMIAQVLPNRPVQPDQATAAAAVLDPVLADLVASESDRAAIPTPAEQARLSNAERVGVDLFRDHPLGIELAGVILLVSLIGAVVIARTQVPDEQRQSPTAGANGVSARPTYEPGPDEPQSIGQSGGRMGV